MNKAIGKVLFIDEAYGLNPYHSGHGSNVGAFMQEVRELNPTQTSHISLIR